jgi:hypothetical protein
MEQQRRRQLRRRGRHRNGRLGNGLHGIVSACSYGCIGNPAWGNVVGANGGHGIYLNGAGMSNLVQNNRVGVGLDGSSDVGNGLSGIAGEQIGARGHRRDGRHERGQLRRQQRIQRRIDRERLGRQPDRRQLDRLGADEHGFPRQCRRGRADRGIHGGQLRLSATASTAPPASSCTTPSINGSRTISSATSPCPATVSTQMLIGIDVQNAGGNRIGGDRGNDVGAAQDAGISISFSDDAELAQWGFPNRVDANRIGTGLNLARSGHQRGRRHPAAECAPKFDRQRDGSQLDRPLP